MVTVPADTTDDILVVSEKGYGKRSDLGDYRITNRGGKGVKTINVTEKTGKLVAIHNVNDENDLMIINKSGIAIRFEVASLRIQGRATQGVRLINLEKRDDEIASVCAVDRYQEEEVPELENSEELDMARSEFDNIDGVSENAEDDNDNE
jgi:DNA gyrase subunit A